MPVIQSAKRDLAKTTYVSLQLAAPPADNGRAMLKFAFVRQLALQPGDVAAVRQVMTDAGGAIAPAITRDSPLWVTLMAFEGTPMPSLLPKPSEFAAVSSDALSAFGRALATRRQTALTVPPAGAAMAGNAAQVAGNALNLANAALVSINAFENQVAATPVGMLNLERLEMVPAGIVRGELLATICLAPKEQTSVVQKEWSVTTKEFTSIVTDSLENYSATGVTENTELAQATTSQVTHSNQFNINSTASGGCGFVSGSASAGFTAQDSSSASASNSRRDAIATTRNASSRVKQEHKTTISTTTVTGQSETTTRTLTNPSDSTPMRIDYFSMMRKWRVRLYRYGLRMTYDLAVPEPGAALREDYEKLVQLEILANQVFSFNVSPASITDQNPPPAGKRYYLDLAAEFGAQVPGPPQTEILTVGGQQVTGIDKNHLDNLVFWPLTFSVPDGYWITNIELNSDVGGNYTFDVIGFDYEFTSGVDGEFVKNRNLAGFMNYFAGSQTITSRFRYADPAMVTFFVTTEPNPSAWAQWQMSVWSACYNAAQTAASSQQNTVSSQIQQLQDQINNVDTLTLRREENDEIMKCMLKWLLGTGFEFMPQEVKDLFAAGGNDLTYGVNFTGDDLSLTLDNWTTMFQYQEMVKFINQALEWENVTYFLYPYFWDVPKSWDFIRRITHPDSTRQAFLRAGSARVVLTVRQGYEKSWTQFVETGDLSSTLPPGHPYMKVAQEIADYDSTNYPGIPPANPSGSSGTQLDPAFALCGEAPAASASPVSIKVDSNAGFIVGLPVIIDTYASGVQETQNVTAVSGDGQHITVAALSNPHDGTKNAFAVSQPGERGQLIGEWYEYTPTSGTDIAVGSDLTQIA